MKAYVTVLVLIVAGMIFGSLHYSAQIAPELAATRDWAVSTSKLPKKTSEQCELYWQVVHGKLADPDNVEPEVQRNCMEDRSAKGHKAASNQMTVIAVGVGLMIVATFIWLLTRSSGTPDRNDFRLPEGPYAHWVTREKQDREDRQARERRGF
jgi:hypothetical protein